MCDFIYVFGCLIDQGCEIGVDVDYINLLIKMMEKLVENCLIDQCFKNFEFVELDF